MCVHTYVSEFGNRNHEIFELKLHESRKLKQLDLFLKCLFLIIFLHNCQESNIIKLVEWVGQCLYFSY